MKDCGPALAKWMKKKTLKEKLTNTDYVAQHSKTSDDDFSLGDEATPDGTYGKDSRKAAKGAKRMENKRV